MAFGNGAGVYYYMDDNKTFFTQVQAPVESETVAESMVKLPRTWVIWENNEAKSGKLD